MKKDADIFVNGRPPKLLYANRQDYGGQKHERPMHTHENICELLLCYSGSGFYHIGNEQYDLKEGDIILYNVGEYHEVISKEDTEIGTYCYGFSDVHFAGLPVNHLVPEGTPFVKPAGKMFPLLRELSERILDMDDSDPLQSLLQQQMAVTLLMIMEKAPAEEKAAPVSDSASYIVEKVKEYINTHYTEPFRLDDIARDLRCSVTYVSHTFKRVTGYSPMQYTIRCRIGLSETLLISSDLTVTTIATMVGYDNTNYFQRLFKKVVGLTPLAYRQRYLSSLHGQRDQK